jgi:hypothetical protein
MTILLPDLAAAFCVCVTVRFVNRRERWAKWTLAALIGMPVCYVASIGPACWISSRTNFGGRAVASVYQPLMRIAAGNSQYPPMCDHLPKTSPLGKILIFANAPCGPSIVFPRRCRSASSNAVNRRNPDQSKMIRFPTGRFDRFECALAARVEPRPPKTSPSRNATLPECPSIARQRHFGLGSVGRLAGG